MAFLLVWLFYLAELNDFLLFRVVCSTRCL